MRTFVTRVVVTAGLIAAAVLGVVTVSQSASGAVARGSLGRGLFSLELAGTNVASIAQVSGGNPVGTVVEARVGGPVANKHLAGIQYQDLSFEVGGMGKGLADWLRTSLSGAGQRKSGAVLEADQNGSVRTRLAFTDAAISGITFSELDASSKDAFTMTVALASDTIRRTTGGGGDPGSTKGPTKRLVASNFRITIPGLDTSRVSKIAPLSVKFKTATGNVGVQREPQKGSGAADISNLVLTLPEAFATSFYTWSDSFLVGGKNGDGEEKTGTIELLDPAGKDVLLTLELKGLGLVSVSTVSSPQSSSPDALALVRAELYVESLGLKVAP